MKAVQPRISLILAVDSMGNAYASLTQVNSGSKVMCLYIRELVKVLDKERGDWRRQLTVCIDGAAYHVSTETMVMFRTLRVPLMVLGPHGYAVAPCELAFAAIKSLNLNPDQLATGKTNFANVVKLLLLRL